MYAKGTTYIPVYQFTTLLVDIYHAFIVNSSAHLHLVEAEEVDHRNDTRPSQGVTQSHFSLGRFQDSGEVADPVEVTDYYY